MSCATDPNQNGAMVFTKELCVAARERALEGCSRPVLFGRYFCAFNGYLETKNVFPQKPLP